MDNYEKLLERICRSSGLSKEEIERKIEAKKAKLSGLISKEGAAQIVAAELGINFDQERLKISELVEGMKKANIIGKVIKLNQVREFNKNGRSGKVASLLAADEHANTRVVLWDTNHIALIEKEKIKEGDTIEISNASVRNNELHLSSFSDIKLSEERIENVIEKAVFAIKKLKDARAGEFFKTRAVIVKAFEPRYFEVCPECGKRVLESECKIHGQIAPSKRALLSLVLDDGTETMRSVLFGEQINALGVTNEAIFSLEEFNKIKSSLLGEEKFFVGQLRNNELYNTTDFTVNSIESVDPQLLIKELEALSIN